MEDINAKYKLRPEPRAVNWAFWVGAVFLVFAVYDFGGVAFKSPYGMHQWRQCDAYSMALNFERESRGLTRPAIHFEHGTGGGEAVGEFPLTYFLNGQLWRVIGTRAWTLRWTHLAVLLLGFGCLNRLLTRVLTAPKAVVVTWFTMASGLMAFYGPNYLVNAAGLGLVYAGWWGAYRWWEGGLASAKWMAWTVGALTLAVLFRPTLVMGWWPLMLAGIGLPRWKRWVFALGAPVAIGLVWVIWTKWLNTQNASVYYLTTIRPIWDSVAPGEVWRAFREDMVPQWYHPYVLTVVAAALLLTSVKASPLRTPIGRWLGWSAVGLVAGSCVYVCLWFDNLNVHDYYLIELQLMVPVVLAWMFKRWDAADGKFPTVAMASMALALALQLTDAALRTRMKHRPVGGWLAAQILPARERGIWDWFHWDQDRRFGNVEAWESILRSQGIDRDDLVISVTDPSPNVSLSLMDQQGFTNLYDDAYQGEERIAHYVGKGAAYLVCNDPDWYEAHKQSPWLSDQMTLLGNFRVFDLLNSDGHLHPQNAVPN